MTIKQLPSPQTGIPEVDRVLNEHVNKLNPILHSIPPAANGQFSQMTWIAITALLNGWTNAFGQFAPVAYMKDTQGFVHLRGLLFNIAGQAANFPAFVLPPGFRPAYTLSFPNVSDVGYCRCNVFANGEVWPSVNIGVAANGFRFFDNIIFDTRI